MAAIMDGDLAPDFILKDGDGQKHSLSQYRGRPVVLYFYPKDDTPGCTKEACNFRDDYSAYETADVVILGVSADDEKSHQNFKTKYHLPFPLLSDTSREVINLYGVWGKKTMFGNEYEGIKRTTFLINAEGKIARIFKNVKPSTHSKQVLAAIENLA
jgi:peroxiredoxin Q/BCP